MNPSSAPISFTADRNQADQRLDRLLRKEYPQLPLSRIFSLLRQKRVKVNGVRADGATRVQEGDRIELFPPFELIEQLKSAQKKVGMAPQEKGSNFSPKGFTLVAEEPGEWIVLNKKSGVAAHPGTAVAPGESLIEELWKFRPEFEKFKPALAHRLDKETSGLVIAALSAPALRQLTSSLRERRSLKRYLALVAGIPKRSSGTIELKLTRIDSASGGAKSIADEESGVEAVTHWNLLESFSATEEWPATSLLSVELGTGRMHQIRSHLAAIGHPLLGDDRYGNFELNRLFRRKIGLKRVFLHASELQFPKLPKWEAPLPPELERVIAALR